jgi:hypothetical protein
VGFLEERVSKMGRWSVGTFARTASGDALISMLARRMLDMLMVERCILRKCLWGIVCLETRSVDWKAWMS